MTNVSYWKKQQPGTALFPNVEWSRPERRDQAGRLAIVGGYGGGFWAVANAFQVANQLGVGEIRILIPDALKSKIPTQITASVSDLIYLPSNPSGGIANAGERHIITAAHWAGNILFIGDMGGNSETAQMMSRLVEYGVLGDDTTITIARDAVDLVGQSIANVLDSPRAHLVVSLAQLQKIARAVYYPRMISFSQGAKTTAETLHKFTITYPATITLYHDGQIYTAQDGKVYSQIFEAPIRIWNGEMSTRAAVWSIWHSNISEATATSWL